MSQNVSSHRVWLSGIDPNDTDNLTFDWVKSLCFLDAWNLFYRSLGACNSSSLWKAITIIMSGTIAELQNGGMQVKAISTVVSGGARDVFGEDTATEDQTVTPWSRNVAWLVTLLTLSNPSYRSSKGITIVNLAMNSWAAFTKLSSAWISVHVAAD